MLANPSTDRGYTILELSIVLTIVAVLITGGLSSFNEHIHHKRLRITQERLTHIEKALERFVHKNHYLPCPSASNSNESDAGFGIANTYDPTIHACLSITNNTGAVPVYSLQLSTEYSYDGWNRKFTYRVATGLGDRDNFTARIQKEDLFSGDIKVTDLYGIEKTSTFYDPPHGAAYVVISHGANGIGAWHKNSTETPGTDINSPELENLNHALNNRYIQSHTPTAEFDDILVFKEKSTLFPRYGTSPLFISPQTCSNAFDIVRDGNPLNYANDLSNYGGAFGADQLMYQVYTSASILADMCDNPPAIPTPQTVAGLTLWLDASDHDTILPAPNGDITTWVDKSVNNYQLIQTVALNRPTHIMDPFTGQSSVSFTGNHHLLLEKLYGKDMFSSDQATFFFVLDNRGSGVGATWFHWSNNLHNIQFSISGSSEPQFTYTDANLFPSVNASATIPSISIVTALKSPPSSGNLFNIGVLFGGAPTSSFNASTVDVNSARSLIVGSDNTFFSNWNGNIYEILVYNRGLSDDEQEQIQQYLVDKWLF